MDYFPMCMLDEIRAKREEIYAIARAHKAKSFGCLVRAHMKGV